MTTIVLHPTPQILDAAAETMLDEIYPDVLDLVTKAIETTIDGTELAKIKLGTFRDPEDESGWRELVISIVVAGSEDDAFAYWHRVEDYIEAGTDSLSLQGRKQLAAILSVEVLAGDAY